jgi:hypothetical protein
MSMKKVICNAITADVPTRTGLIYSREALERVVEQSNNQSKQHRCLVVSDEYAGRPMLKDVVGKVHEATIEDGKLVCQVEMLETPRARELGELLNQGFSISPCMYGNIKGKVVDPKTLTLDGWSLVFEKP